LYCHTIKVQKRGVRRGKVKYYCCSCHRWFQVNRGERKVKPGKLVLEHLDGVSFRSLADRYQLSLGNVYNKVTNYLKGLPHCADITRQYCTKYGGILEVDGKYLKVKGYERKIPVVYGIDYQTHDIPSYLLSEAENYQTLVKFFGSLKLSGYPLQAVICDENSNIWEACRYVYPQAAVQLCQNHYKENIRRLLDLSHNPQHLGFMKQVEELFAFKRAPGDFVNKGKQILNRYQENEVYLTVMAAIHRNQHLLLGWQNGHHIPTTTNLIECFNSHLQGRLKTIKGFETFKHANLWLNGYFLRRRQKKFTSCQGKFRKLNGFTSLQKSKKPDSDIPSFFD